MAGKIRLIGAVGIKVRPDTTEFKKELREQIKTLPDYDIEVNVDADTTIAKRKIEKLKAEAEKNSLKLRIDEDVYDDLKAAQATIRKAIADLSRQEITVGLNSKELEAKLKNLERKARGASVNMEINSDKAGYEAALAKIRTIQRQKAVMPISFKTDNKSLAEEARKYEKLLADLPEPVKTITITHRNDHESLTKAIAQIDEAMAKINEVKLTPKMSWAELQAQKKLLQKELATKPLVMKVTEDKASYEAVLKKILTLQEEAAATEFKFKTDEQGLATAAATIRAKIAALTPKPQITFSYENDTRGLNAAMAEVDKKLAEMRHIKLVADLDEEGLLKVKDELENQLSTSSFAINVDSSDLDKLKAERKKLEEMMALNAIQDVEIHVENTPESLEEAKRQLDELIKQREAPIKAKPLTFEAMMELAYASRTRDVPFYVRINQRSLAIAEGVLQSLAGINVLRSGGRGLESLITKFDTISIKAGLIGAAIGAVTNTFIYLATSLFPVGEGILNVVGLLAMAPAALAAVTATALINIAAWKNFKGAVDGSAEAMAALPPEAQRTAKALQGVWDKMQKPIQTNFWKGMGDSMATSFQAFLPIVEEGLSSAAEHVGRFGAGVFRSFEKISQSGNLKTMFDNLSLMFDNAAGAAEPLFDAINRIGLRGSEYLPRFGEWVTELTTRFDNWIKKADEAGKINVWIEEGVQSLKDMWTLSGGIIKMFQAIGTAAEKAGAGGLHDVAVRFSEIGDIMQGELFQTRLATIFDGARKGASELNVGVKALGKSFGESSVFVANMLQELGRLGGGLLTNIAHLFSNIQFQSGVLDGLEGMNEMMLELRSGASNLGTVIGNLGSIAGAAFGSIGPVINQVIELLASVTGVLGPELMQLIPTLMTMVGGFISSLTGPATLMAETLANVLSWINSLPGPLSSLVISFAAFVLLAGKIGPIFQAKPGGFLEKLKYDFQQADGARDKFMTGAKGIGAGLLGAVGGPWGIAIGLVTTGLGLMGSKAAEAKSRVDEYTASLDANTGAMTANTFANAAKNLLDEGGLWNDRWRGAQKTQDVIEGLGLSFQNTAKLAAQGGPAYDDLISKLDKYPGVTSDAGNTMGVFADAMGISEEAASKFSKGDIIHLKQRLGEISTEAGTGAANFGHLTDSVNRVPMTDAQRKIEDFNTAMRAYNDTTSTADTRTRALDTALRILRGEKVDLTTATRTANDSMRAMAGSTSELNGKIVTTGGAFRDANGNVRNFKGVIDETTGVIDTQTEAGSNLSRMLQTATDDTKAVATGMKDAGKPIEEVSKYLDGQRDSFIKLGTDAGLNKDVVTKAYDEMMKANPQTLLTTIMAEGVDEAESKLKNYQGSLEKVNGYKAVAQIMGDNVVLGVALADSYGKLEEFDKVVATATANLDPAQADAVRQRLITDLVTLASTNPTVLATLDPRLLDEERVNVTERINELGRMKPSPLVDAQVEDAKQRLGQVQGMLDKVGATKPQPKVEAKTEETDSKLDGTKGKLDALGWMKPKAVVDADVQAALNKIAGIETTVKNTKPVMTVGVSADDTYFQQTLSRLRASAKLANGGIMNGASVQQFANGGFWGGRPVHTFAGGGMENHVAQIARGATPYRVWAEPETGGEAYIPLAQAKRGRSTQILEQVAKQFGYTLSKAQAFADGGVVNGGNARATGGLQISIDTFNQNANDTIEDVGRGIMRQARNAGVAGILDGI